MFPLYRNSGFIRETKTLKNVYSTVLLRQDLVMKSTLISICKFAFISNKWQNYTHTHTQSKNLFILKINSLKIYL